uniref:Protein kinase domain-containing protein n=1 Tax=Anatid alphaherpesvirus 2 TaxID=3080522 RepID=A0AAU0K6Z2_9ALPH
MHYTQLDLNETPIYAGSGSYGEVKIYPRANVAVKTAIDGFRSELLMTLLVSECAIRARTTLAESRIISLLAFSLPSKQMVFPKYDMDMSSYCRKLAKMQHGSRHWRALERAFMGLGRAVVFLNIGCGLTHLDIKCGNIFVNVSDGPDPVVEEAVIGDFSLMILNSNSTVMRGRFDVEVGHSHPHTIRVCRGNVQPMFELVLGHGQTQPCEIMLNAVNGDGLLKSKSPLSSDDGVAIDMYALGQSLLELILSAGMCTTYGFGVPRNPIYYYYHRTVRRDYVLDTLAYRCAFYHYIFPSTPLTAQHDVPWERVDSIRSRINGERYKTAFDAHYARYQMTHKQLFDCMRIPPKLNQVLELAALYCHSNPRARTATALLWR